MLGRVTGMASRAPDPDNGNGIRVIASAGHQYDDRDRRHNTRREDGTLWTYGYNDRSEVTSAIKTTANSELVPGQSFGYVFDGMGNRITSTAGTGANEAVTNYGRDALNRYTSIATPGVADVLARSEVSVTFTVDQRAVSSSDVANTGNLYSAHATVGNSPDGKYFPVSITAGTTTKTGFRWLAPASVVPQYDDDGNLLQDGRWNYVWDGENRLVRMTTLTSAVNAGAPDLTIEYCYDWRGRMIGRKLTRGSSPTDERIIYDGWNPVAEFSVEDGLLVTKKTLLWGPDLSGTLQGAGGVGGLVMISDCRSTPAVHYIPGYNTNGDIIAWSDSTGRLIRRMDYDPFENLILCETFSGDSADLDKFLTHGFSTKPADPETGLLYYGYRWYDPVTGRWMSKDPIGEKGGVNLYGFVGNDGVKMTDMLGLDVGPGAHLPGSNPIPIWMPSINGGGSGRTATGTTVSLALGGNGPSVTYPYGYTSLWATVDFEIYLQRNNECACMVSRLEYMGTANLEGQSTEYFYHGLLNGRVDLVDFYFVGPQNGGSASNYNGEFENIRSDSGNSIQVVWTYRIYRPCPKGAKDSFNKMLGGQPAHVAQTRLWQFNENVWDWSEKVPEFWDEEHHIIVGGQYVITIAQDIPTGIVPDGSDPGGWYFSQPGDHLAPNGRSKGVSGMPGWMGEKYIMPER